MERSGDLLTRCRAGPLWLDVRSPVRHEGRHDLALRLGLVQKLVMVRIALRYTCCVFVFCAFFAEVRVSDIYILYGRMQVTPRTDEHAIAHKSAHLATRVDREPFTQDELQPVPACTFTTGVLIVLVLGLVLGLIVAVVVVIVHAPLKDRLGTEIMHDKVGRLQERVHLCGRRASQRRGGRGQKPCRILRTYIPSQYHSITPPQ